VTSTRPSGSVVALGYQRRCDMSGTFVHVSVTGSKMLACDEPRCPLASSWPPTTRMRPSPSCAWPEQNRLSATGTGVKRFVAGSHTVAERPPADSPRYMRILPVCSWIMLTATSPSSIGAVQRPASSGGGGGGGAGASPTGVAMSAWISAASSARL
jgi:hypothetical protein